MVVAQVTGQNLNQLQKNKIILINDGCHGLKEITTRSYAIRYADWRHSFHPVKPITTGEGGAVITNNKFVDSKIKQLRTWYYKKLKKFWHNDMKNLGFNYRITDFQCALELANLLKLKFINERRQIATYYNKQFKNLENIKIPEEPANLRAHIIYMPRINFKK